MEIRRCRWLVLQSISRWIGEGIIDYTGEYDDRSDEGHLAGIFSEENKHPNRVKDGFKGAQQSGFEGRDVLYGDGIEQERQSHLKQAEVSQDGPVEGRPMGLKDEWETEHGGEQVGQEDTFSRVGLFLSAHGDHHQCHGNTTESSQKVAVKPIQADSPAEKQDQAGEDHRQRDPVGFSGFLMQEPVSQEDDIDGGGVLEEDGIGSRGELDRGYVQELGEDIASGGEDLPAGEFAGKAFEIEAKNQTGKDAAAGKNGDRRPVHQPDENSAGAPQDGGDDEKDDGSAAVDGDTHGEDSSNRSKMVD